jgi:hypothetical protein
MSGSCQVTTAVDARDYKRASKFRATLITLVRLKSNLVFFCVFFEFKDVVSNLEPALDVLYPKLCLLNNSDLSIPSED